MRILCCYHNNDLSTEALRSFGEHCPYVEMVNITGDWGSREAMMVSQTRLWHEMRDRWQGKEDLVILNEMTPIPADLVSSFGECESLLCLYDNVFRYSAELQRKIPHETIAGDYCVWHLVNERLTTLWWLHKIEVCVH